MIRLQHIKKINRLCIICAMTLIRCYQLVVSPILGSACRFEPSCSQYALTAIDRHGLFKGSSLAIRRLLRCQPWHPGGFDPVPDR